MSSAAIQFDTLCIAGSHSPANEPGRFSSKHFHDREPRSSVLLNHLPSGHLAQAAVSYQSDQLIICPRKKRIPFLLFFSFSFQRVSRWHLDPHMDPSLSLGPTWQDSRIPDRLSTHRFAQTSKCFQPAKSGPHLAMYG